MQELLHLHMRGRIEIIDVFVALECHQEGHELLFLLFDFLQGLLLYAVHVIYVYFEALTLHVSQELAEWKPVFLIDLPGVDEAFVCGRFLLF